MARFEDLHFWGYHGTSIENARRILDMGFSFYNDDVFFAPSDNLSFAKSHGKRRAVEHADSSFGVVQALFPGHELELGLDGDQIHIPREEVERIKVIGFMAYNLSGGLIERVGFPESSS